MGEYTEKQVLQRLRALALTDSIHFFKHRRITRQGFDWLATNCIDWVSSGLPTLSRTFGGGGDSRVVC
jgi:hypothetical protein